MQRQKRKKKARKEERTKKERTGGRAIPYKFPRLGRNVGAIMLKKAHPWTVVGEVSQGKLALDEEAREMVLKAVSENPHTLEEAKRGSAVVKELPLLSRSVSASRIPDTSGKRSGKSVSMTCKLKVYLI